MKKKIKRKKKGFDTVKFFRKVKREISKEIQGMSREEIVEHFSKAPRIIGISCK